MAWPAVAASAAPASNPTNLFICISPCAAIGLRRPSRCEQWPCQPEGHGASILTRQTPPVCRNTRHFARICPLHSLPYMSPAVVPRCARDRSTAPISRVAPRRDQKRHVIVPLRLGDGELDRDKLEERRIRQWYLQPRKVRSNMEAQLIAANGQGPPADQGLAGGGLIIREPSHAQAQLR